MIIVMFFLALFVFPFSPDYVGAAPQMHPPVSLRILPADARAEARTLKVVLMCDTPESRSRGLQGFQKLKKNEAALFLFDKPEHVSFWMGSVSYPIDIIFVTPEGKVNRVFKNLQPGSLEIYSSGAPVQWAIETAAGSGIKRGDSVKMK